MPVTAEQQAIIDKLLADLDRVALLRDILDSAPGSVVGAPIGPVPLSINERTLIAEALLKLWLTPKEYKAYRRQRELELYEATKKLAHHGVPYGQRQQWVQAIYGKSGAALKRFVRHRRKKGYTFSKKA